MLASRSSSSMFQVRRKKERNEIEAAIACLPPVLLAPGGEVLQRFWIGRGIEAEDALTRLHTLSDEILIGGHLERLVGDLVGEMYRDHDHAVTIAQDHVAGEYRRIATGDRHVDVDGVV